jgi:hypothetical protein
VTGVNLDNYSVGLEHSRLAVNRLGIIRGFFNFEGWPDVRPHNAQTGCADAPRRRCGRPLFGAGQQQRDDACCTCAALCARRVRDTSGQLRVRTLPRCNARTGPVGILGQSVAKLCRHPTDRGGRQRTTVASSLLVSGTQEVDATASSACLAARPPIFWRPIALNSPARRADVLATKRRSGRPTPCGAAASANRR